ncbi:hypothetical protein M9H77_31907 [Catharanthus roseus]|uniref:Uncharacterized protein n=1 Tax=Catharanthus roseus TaxID=4058 RepID=A0ACC0A2F6_CATRO|nr:hypothetical protein M9H77_31907 [Catharanthus roseus]
MKPLLVAPFYYSSSLLLIQHFGGLSTSFLERHSISSAAFVRFLQLFVRFHSCSIVLVFSLRLVLTEEGDRCKNAFKSKDLDLRKENKSNGENLYVQGRVDRRESLVTVLKVKGCPNLEIRTK